MTDTLKVKLDDEQMATIIYKVTEKMMLDANRIEVVRCKDCKYFVKGRDWFSCQKWYMDIRKDDYCSYGERKQK